MFTNNTVKNDWRNFSVCRNGNVINTQITTEDYGDTHRVCFRNTGPQPDESHLCNSIAAIATKYYQDLPKEVQPSVTDTISTIAKIECSVLRKISDITHEIFSRKNASTPDIKFYVYLEPGPLRANEMIWEVPLAFKDGKFVETGQHWKQHGHVPSLIKRHDGSQPDFMLQASPS